MEDLDNSSLFQEPEGYFKPEQPPKITTYGLEEKSGKTTEFKVRLVGNNPLWGHFLWPASTYLASHLQNHQDRLVHNKTVLELGAGAGLPSLVAAHLGAKRVLITDYPDADLVANLHYNIAEQERRGLIASKSPEGKLLVAALGYKWGTELTFPEQSADSGDGRRKSTEKGEAERYDTVIMADLLFNHSEHGALLQTLLKFLRRSDDARALIFFTPHRPWLLEKDLSFLKLISEHGLRADEVGEWKLDKPMFPEDRGDEDLRRTIFGYEVSWVDAHAEVSCSS